MASVETRIPAIAARRAAEPLSELAAPHGVYFVAGNHEQFGDDSKYLHAIASAGVRVLSNEKVEVDGLQIVGVPYRNAARDGHLASVLRGIRLDRDRASILLTHAPDHPKIAEAAGVSLQLSGHTQPWAVHSLELDGAADLPAVCVWVKPDREDAGFHLEWSWNVGTAAAAGIPVGWISRQDLLALRSRRIFFS
jgi:hypothetical protein